ncbi:MAG: hypothetical protein FH753_04515 [Firmicutes bacterium]|nr:hypothetical protein [Bacillota bacterium]
MSHYIDDFHKWLVENDKKKSSIKEYICASKEFISWWEDTVCEKFKPIKVVYIDIQEYKQYLIKIRKGRSGKRLSPSSINKKLTGIKAYFKFLCKKDIIETNITLKIKCIKYDKYKNIK